MSQGGCGGVFALQLGDPGKLNLHCHARLAFGLLQSSVVAIVFNMLSHVRFISYLDREGCWLDVCWSTEQVSWSPCLLFSPLG